MLEKQRIQENETKEKLETEISDILKQEEEMKIIKKNKEEDVIHFITRTPEHIPIYIS